MSLIFSLSFFYIIELLFLEKRFVPLLFLRNNPFALITTVFACLERKDHPAGKLRIQLLQEVERFLRDLGGLGGGFFSPQGTND
jgi:hypothetical protein